jgi:hypothetical protein
MNEISCVDLREFRCSTLFILIDRQSDKPHFIRFWRILCFFLVLLNFSDFLDQKAPELTRKHSKNRCWVPKSITIERFVGSIYGFFLSFSVSVFLHIDLADSLLKNGRDEQKKHENRQRETYLFENSYDRRLRT